MKTKLWTTAVVIISTLTLSACQTLSVSSSESNFVPDSSDSKDYEHENIITLVPDIPDSDGDGVLDDIDNCPKTPANVAVDESGCPVSVSLIGPLMMEIRVFFERNSTEFKVDAYLTEINKVAEKIRENPELIILLSGHISKLEAVQIQVASNKQADQIKFYNSQLARNRAQLVKNRLINQGIAADKIHTFDCGYNIQISPNDTEEGASMNQRVFGTVMEAARIYANNNYSDTHSFKHYKKVCEEF